MGVGYLFVCTVNLWRTRSRLYRGRSTRFTHFCNLRIPSGNHEKRPFRAQPKRDFDRSKLKRFVKCNYYVDEVFDTTVVADICQRFIDEIQTVAKIWPTFVTMLLHLRMNKPWELEQIDRINKFDFQSYHHNSFN